MKLNEAYQRDGFLQFIRDDFLPDFQKDIRPVNIKGFSSIQKANYLGESKNLDLQIFEFVIKGSTNKRVTLTKEAFQVMRSSAIFQALAVFYSEESNDWRFSLMTAIPEPTEKGKVTMNYSNPKRLSFFLGPNAKVNTPIKFLVNKGKVLDFKNLKERFSIEVVNREFYKAISEKFTKLVSGLLKLPSVREKSQVNLEFAVRLIGRIIFCWFLREKKSDKNISLMPKELLSIEAVQKNTNYYHKILEPIFFEILNKKIRKDEFSNNLFSLIPYLNGGLFSNQDDDFYKRNSSDFQSQFYNTLIIPDKWFLEFFEVLETYNFTIDENTSFDEELSIDPEMLGRIFENLLAEINPETGESARKNTGSYYTPRVIVDYMVDESLLLYIKGKTGIDDKKLKAVISYDLNDDSENPLTNDEKEKVINCLEKVKILDPACGSGAFPIGTLQKIVFILQQIDQDGKLWFKKQVNKTSPEVKRVIEREFAHKNFDYIRKLGIIRENIYGIDIQPIATEISRLRCFLTLIVDERIQDESENRGIEPLPNLDFKFVTANSLIGLPKVDEPQGTMFDDYQKIDELKKIRDEYFNSSGIEREQLKTQFVTQQKLLFKDLQKEHGWQGINKAELTNKLTDWDPFSHKSTPWFDPEWMFGIKDGFDIIIGNPPYFSSEEIKDPEKSIYKLKYKVDAPRCDIYCYFKERGVQLLVKNGVLTFITSNKWLRALYGKKLRSLLINDTNVIKLIDFNGHKVFEATVDTNIIILQNEKVLKNYNITFANIQSDFYGENLDGYLSEHQQTIGVENLKNNAWSLVDEKSLKIKEKIMIAGTPLENWDIKINYGIKTGFNDAFIIDSQTKERLCKEDPKSIEILKRIVRGRDINRYRYHWADLWLIKIESGWTNKNYYGKNPESFLQKQYPSIYNHIISFKKSLGKGKGLENRDDQGNYWWELRDCDYYNEFEKVKIAFPVINRKWSFPYVDKNIYILAPMRFISSDNKKTILYLQSILVSNLMKYFWKNYGSMQDATGFQMDSYIIERLPIPKISIVNQQAFIDLIDKIHTIAKEDDYIKNVLKKAQLCEYEKQIDKMVYELYGLTKEEISIVENTNKNI